jgi:hypothetical protein
MKRFFAALTAIALGVAIATPATAAVDCGRKPDHPTCQTGAEDSAYYTLQIASDELGTTCETDVIVQRNGIHFEWYYDSDDEALPDDIALNLAAEGLAWEGESVAGCRSAGLVETYFLDGSVETSPPRGYFRITLEDDDTVAMLWIFDIYERYDEVQQNKKRTSLEHTTRTDFRMGGPYVDGEFATGEWVTGSDGSIIGTVAGTFNFVRFERGGDPLFTDLTNGDHHFAIDFKLTPYDPEV